MARFAPRAFAILALLVVCLEMSSSPWSVQAADDADAPAADVAAADVQVAESAEGSEAAEGTEVAEAEGASLTEEQKEEKGQEFVDSARELQEKLGQLRALLDAKGEGADPALKERLAGLESQLNTLGLDGLGGGAAGPVGSNPQLTEFLGACVSMSIRRAGMQRPATLGALRKLVNNKLPPAEAAKNELWRMVAVCVTDFKEDEFASFKSGKVKILPKVYVDEAKKPEAEKKVLEIDEQVWGELRKISEGLLKELQGDPELAEKPPFNVAYLAFIPFLGMCGLIGYGFMKMNKGNEEKAGKKDKKAAKKSN